MNKIIDLLLGRNSNPWMVTGMLLAPTFLVIFIILSYPFSIYTVITALLAFDIVAGLLSNARKETHQAWNDLPRSALVAFVVVHVTVYPLGVILFRIDDSLMILLLGLLFVKTSFFIIGTKESLFTK